MEQHVLAGMNTHVTVSACYISVITICKYRLFHNLSSTIVFNIDNKKECYFSIIEGFLIYFEFINVFLIE